jgi:predicted Zn-dependent peptidase
MIKCQKQILHNGLRMVAVEMPTLHSAEVALYVKVGGRNDPSGKAGLAHFLEHMLFRGTAEHPTNLELETAFEAIGGSVNASTDEECTCYFSKIHPDHIAAGVALFSSMLLRPSLQGVDVEKRIITEEALEDLNDKGEEINTHTLASRLLWPDHPLGQPTVGSLESIQSFTRDDLLKHLATYYVPGNCVLVAAGKVQADRFFAAGEAAFSSWPGVSPPPLVPVTALPAAGPGSLFVADPDSQVHLQVSFRGVARGDRRFVAARLLRRILCGGGSSRLHLNLRERLGIVYSVDAYVAGYEETGAFAIDLATAPENLLKAVSEVLAEAGRLCRGDLGHDELERVRQGYFYDLEYSRDSGYEMQVRYGWGELMGVGRDIEEDLAAAADLTATDICTAAGELFCRDNLHLVAVGPWRKADKRSIEKILAAYSPG